MADRPPPLDGVRRSFVEANGVRFHVTEAGPPDGRPVVALHGWPQHHWEYRDLLADPPAGLRIIAPDLPGYGWSGPAPHKWAKRDVGTDVLALLDVLGLDRVLLVAHDWGGAVGYHMVLDQPARSEGYLVTTVSLRRMTGESLSRALTHLGDGGVEGVVAIAPHISDSTCSTMEAESARDRPISRWTTSLRSARVKVSISAMNSPRQDSYCRPAILAAPRAAANGGLRSAGISSGRPPRPR